MHLGDYCTDLMDIIKLLESQAIKLLFHCNSNLIVHYLMTTTCRSDLGTVRTLLIWTGKTLQISHLSKLTQDQGSFRSRFAWPCCLLHVIHENACTLSCTCSTSLMGVKNSMHHFCLWNFLSGTLEWKKWKKDQKHQITSLEWVLQSVWHISNIPVYPSKNHGKLSQAIQRLIQNPVKYIRCYKMPIKMPMTISYYIFCKTLHLWCLTYEYASLICSLFGKIEDTIKMYSVAM